MKSLERNSTRGQFHPEERLKEVLRKPGAERPQALAEWKKKYAEQRLLLAALQADVIAELRKSPDMSREEIGRRIEEVAEKGRLTETQLAIANAAADIYVEKRKAMHAVREKYPNDRDLFIAVFGFKPFGQVVIENDPMSLNFVCNNELDFIRLDTLGKGKFSLMKELLQRIGGQRVAGLSLGSRHALPELRGALMAENASATTDTDRGLMRKHEEQHIFRRLLLDAKERVDTEKLLDTTLMNEEAATGAEIEISTERITQNIADELLARLKTAEGVLNIFEKMKHHYHDVFIGSRVEALRSNFEEFEKKHRGDPQAADKVTRADRIKVAVIKHLKGREFWEKMWYAMMNAVGAYGKVRRGTKMSHEELTALFDLEPLKQWPKLADRLIQHEKQKNSAQ